MKLFKPILFAVCLALGACGNMKSAPDDSTTGVRHPTDDGGFSPVVPPPVPSDVESKSSALSESQIWYPANIGGPITNDHYVDCQGLEWQWREYIYQYKIVTNGVQTRWLSFYSAVNWPSEIDYNKNEVSMQCSEDLQERNFSNALMFPYKSYSTKPDIVCDLWAHHAGEGWNFSVRTTIPWDLSYYLPIANGWPIGNWNVYLKFPPQFSSNWGTGYGFSCWASNSGMSHAFNIDL